MNAQHIDTCLPCYLTDHHNRDGELLMSVPITGATTYGELAAALHSDLSGMNIETDEPFDYVSAHQAIGELFSTVSDLGKPFDSSLEIPADDDDSGESVCAFILLTF